MGLNDPTGLEFGDIKITERKAPDSQRTRHVGKLEVGAETESINSLGMIGDARSRVRTCIKQRIYGKVRRDARNIRAQIMDVLGRQRGIDFAEAQRLSVLFDPLINAGDELTKEPKAPTLENPLPSDLPDDQ